MRKKTVGYTESINFICLEDLQQTKNLEIIEPISLRYCGREQCNSGHSFGPYTRSNYLIHVVLSGKGSYSVGNVTREIHENQAFLITPGTETIYAADKCDPWQYVWIAFQGYKAKSMVEMMGFSEDNPVISLSDTDELDKKISELLDTKEISYANELKRKSIFYNILMLLIEGRENQSEEDPKEEADEMSNVYVKMAVNMIIASYQKKLRVADIADKIGINRSYLTNLFKKKMNMSPQEFLINFRLEKAAELLWNTDDPIRSIAVSTGYDDSMAFSKAFKQKYQMTPSAYRVEAPYLVSSFEKGDYVSVSGL